MRLSRINRIIMDSIIEHGITSAQEIKDLFLEHWLSENIKWEDPFDVVVSAPNMTHSIMRDFIDELTRRDPSLCERIRTNWKKEGFVEFHIDLRKICAHEKI